MKFDSTVFNNNNTNFDEYETFIKLYSHFNFNEKY